jgi:hypothetical protein
MEFAFFKTYFNYTIYNLFFCLHNFFVVYGIQKELLNFAASLLFIVAPVVGRLPELFATGELLEPVLFWGGAATSSVLIDVIILMAGGDCKGLSTFLTCNNTYFNILYLNLSFWSFFTKMKGKITSSTADDEDDVTTMG